MRFSLEIVEGIKHPDVFAELIRQGAYGVQSGHGKGVVYFEGNTVGKWEVTDTPSDPIERMYAEAFAGEGEDEKKFVTVDGVTVEDICEQCGKNISQCTCDSDLCECGRPYKDCIAFDNGDSFQHGDR